MTGGAASSRQADLPVLNDGPISNDAHDPAPDVTHRFLKGGKLNHQHLRREIKHAAYLSRSVIARIPLYVMAHYPSWSGDLTRIVLGVSPMRLAREITARDMARFPHLAQGGPAYLRPHSGQTFLYENGAFRLPQWSCARSRRSRDARNTPIM